MKPRRNLGFTSKSSKVSKRREKRLLGCITSVFLSTEHPVRKRKNTALPATHDLAESFRIPTESSLYNYLVGGNGIHALVNGARQLIRPSQLLWSLGAQAFRRGSAGRS